MERQREETTEDDGDGLRECEDKSIIVPSPISGWPGLVLLLVSSSCLKSCRRWARSRSSSDPSGSACTRTRTVASSRVVKGLGLIKF